MKRPGGLTWCGWERGRRPDKNTISKAGGEGKKSLFGDMYWGEVGRHLSWRVQSEFAGRLQGPKTREKKN